jgi:hypothetical protein
VQISTKENDDRVEHENEDTSLVEDEDEENQVPEEEDDADLLDVGPLSDLKFDFDLPAPDALSRR